MSFIRKNAFLTFLLPIQTPFLRVIFQGPCEPDLYTLTITKIPLYCIANWIENKEKKKQKHHTTTFNISQQTKNTLTVQLCIWRYTKKKSQKCNGKSREKYFIFCHRHNIELKCFNKYLIVCERMSINTACVIVCTRQS